MKIIQTILAVTTLIIFTNCQSNSTIDEATSPINISHSEQVNESQIEIKPLTEEELKHQLHKIECSSPTNYLTAQLSINPIYKNFLSVKVKGVKLRFNILNSAAIATFKDLKIKVKFKAKTGATVKEGIYNIYEYVRPNKSITYKVQTTISNQEYNDFTSTEITILSANCQ